MASGETKKQEMTSGDVLVCRIPLLICFESTGCEKRGGLLDMVEQILKDLPFQGKKRLT